jgi:hypothetical protein
MGVAQKLVLRHKPVTIVGVRAKYYRVQAFSVFRQHARLVEVQEKQFAKNARPAEDMGSPKLLWNERSPYHQVLTMMSAYGSVVKVSQGQAVDLLATATASLTFLNIRF